MSEIAILVPVLDRPRNAARVLASIDSTIVVEHRVLFLATPSDEEEIAACHEAAEHRDDVDVHVCEFERVPGDFARKTNLGFHLSEEPWVFLGADDLRFHPGWDEAVLRVGANARVGVVGTQDLGNPKVRRGLLSTHSLVRRSYIDEWGGSLDGPGFVYHEGYDHNYVDEELCALARRRGAFAFARSSIVEHQHPSWPRRRGAERKAEMDATYELAMAGFRADRERFRQRARIIQRQPVRKRVVA